MTTETPYTVADLRRWADEARADAGRRIGYARKAVDGIAQRAHRQEAAKLRAQAAAFDALADGIEACAIPETVSVCSSSQYAAGCNAERVHIGRILRGEKPT